MIAVIDYGMGNLRSVVNAFEAIGHTAIPTQAADDLRRADAIVLPGVGAFGDGMRNLERLGIIPALTGEVRGRGKPYLGICLGMQFLADKSTEWGGHPGLGWIPGVVERLEPFLTPALLRQLDEAGAWKASASWTLLADAIEVSGPENVLTGLATAASFTASTLPDTDARAELVVDLGAPRSMDRLKAQMLHRVRQVTGDGVRGVLITEFALL